MPSSVIKTFRFFPPDTLEIVFVSGRRYRYLGVPPQLHAAMRASFSRGEFFNAHIRGRFDFVRVQDAA